MVPNLGPVNLIVLGVLGELVQVRESVPPILLKPVVIVEPKPVVQVVLGELAVIKKPMDKLVLLPAIVVLVIV